MASRALILLRANSAAVTRRVLLFVTTDECCVRNSFYPIKNSVEENEITIPSTGTSYTALKWLRILVLVIRQSHFLKWSTRI
jgi:hypothetical protein